MAILQSGMTQREVAMALGIHDNRLSAIIHGWRAVTKDEKKALAKLLKRPAAHLFAEPEATSEAVR